MFLLCLWFFYVYRDIHDVAIFISIGQHELPPPQLGPVATNEILLLTVLSSVSLIE
jgi:hypothetical protein